MAQLAPKVSGDFLYLPLREHIERMKSTAETTDRLSHLLSQISLVTANYGEGIVLSQVINDWFNFLGGKPGEVVVIDCGSDRHTQEACWNLFQEGKIDKLQVIHPTNDDFGKEKGYIKEYTAGAIASKPYVLVFKTDTLPYRKGHDNWLIEAVDYLEREDVFAISGSYNMPCKHHDAWDGWYFSQKCSYNFALMKREKFIASAHEFANDFILSGFSGQNPAAYEGKDRYFIEVAFEKYMEQHNVFTLMKVEDPDWTVFHTNVHDAQLKAAREQYVARKNITKYMNAGLSEEIPDPSKALYYGQPPDSLLRQLQIAFGESKIGPYWRSIKRQITQKELAND
ncbi:MAG: hypothetical protein ACAF41_06850 [Leptolyngbya sp. BL-A-14]